MLFAFFNPMSIYNEYGVEIGYRRQQWPFPARYLQTLYYRLIFLYIAISDRRPAGKERFRLLLHFGFPLSHTEAAKLLVTWSVELLPR